MPDDEKAKPTWSQAKDILSEADKNRLACCFFHVDANGKIDYRSAAADFGAASANAMRVGVHSALAKIKSKHTPRLSKQIDASHDLGDVGYKRKHGPAHGSPASSATVDAIHKKKRQRRSDETMSQAIKHEVTTDASFNVTANHNDSYNVTAEDDEEPYPTIKQEHEAGADDSFIH